MTETNPYRIHGAIGSPYSMKMRAILRYRRLPHVWIQMNAETGDARSHVKVPVIPVIQYPDGSYHNDSTPMLYELEKLHPGQRSIVPDDAGDAFIGALLEDMADEWGTKLMFHYRWFRARDQEQMSEWLSFDRVHSRKVIKEQARVFRDRQVGRMALVGCTEENKPLIEETGTRIFAAFEDHVTESYYFFGSRPSLAEFSWFGQMSQLIVDPTPNDLHRITAPFTVRWIMQMDDLSGVDGVWKVAPYATVVERLLKLAGEVYFPFLLANAEAGAKGADKFSFKALGMPYEQAVFKYQAKCLEALRARYRALSGAARERVDPILERTGCRGPLAG